MMLSLLCICIVYRLELMKVKVVGADSLVSGDATRFLLGVDG